MYRGAFLRGSSGFAEGIRYLRRLLVDYRPFALRYLWLTDQMFENTMNFLGTGARISLRDDVEVKHIPLHLIAVLKVQGKLYADIRMQILFRIFIQTFLH